MKDLCAAMLDAGIRDPESHEGIQYCLHCPFPECILFISKRSPARGKRTNTEEIKGAAKKLRELKFTIDEIAKILDKNPRTISRYLE